jgi:hypothetical protein
MLVAVVVKMQQPVVLVFLQLLQPVLQSLFADVSDP